MSSISSEKLTQDISRFLSAESAPYQQVGLSPPTYSALELARRFNTSSSRIVSLITNEEKPTPPPIGKQIDRRFNDRIKRRSNQKRRPWDERSATRLCNRASFSDIRERIKTQLQTERTKIDLSCFQSSTDLEQTRRDEIATRLASRWSSKSEAINRKSVDQPPQLKKYRDVVTQYDLWDSKDGISRQFPLSPDLFPLTPDLYRQMSDIQQAFYGKDGVFAVLKITPPFIMRLDLGLTPENKLKIFDAEIDKTNGFGYMAVASLVRGKDDTLPGISAYIANRSQDKKLGIPLSIQERFYWPEMRALASILRGLGINTKTVTQEDYQRGKYDLLLNWPNSWGNKPYDQESLIPPAADLNDKRLLTQFRLLSPTLVSYIPFTTTITKENCEELYSLVAKYPSRYIVKKAISSGSKGLALTQADVSILLQTNAASSGEYILQEKVIQQQIPFRYCNPGQTQLETTPMYCRVESYIGPQSTLTRSGIIDVLVTARPYLPVNGAKDAIQIAATTKL